MSFEWNHNQRLQETIHRKHARRIKALIAAKGVFTKY